ncbi:hypothetical protein A6035_13050 [Dietzia lutea]|uniref:HTH luxR-type domain-containing protein n=1 Tax=Dietzia lutea TaxID=546160 RepID=A0A2S1R9L5_9ACTN|nr:hypothetical protein A6035_13050 [Dietzia lutea]
MDMTWWIRLTDSVRAAGRGDVPVDEPIRMIRDGLGFDCATLVGPRHGGLREQRSQGGPLATGHPVLVNIDYPGEALNFIATTYAMQCPAHRYAVEHRVARRFIDLPYDFRALRTYKEALEPCGFHEGLTVPLGALHLGASQQGTAGPSAVSPGFLALSSLHGRPLPDDARLALTMLAPDLAKLTDPQPDSIRSPADLVVWASDSRIEPRIGTLTDSPFPAKRLTQIERLHRRANGDLHFRHRDTAGRWWRVDTSSAANGVLIRLERTEPDDRLTVRELDVVGLLSRGWTNDTIAEHLGVSVRTVRTHIESALMKLGVPNRTALAREALRRDLDSLDAIRCAV